MTISLMDKIVDFFRKRSLGRFGYFLIALLFHLVIFLMVATWIVFAAPKPPPEDSFGSVKSIPVKIPPPPQPTSSGDAAANPQMEPQPVMVPVTTPESIITSVNPNFSVNTSKAVEQSLSHVSLPQAMGTGLSQGSGGASSGLGSSSAFGSSNSSPSQLEGYLYDLKQTQNRKPTGITTAQYHQILQKLVQSNWDENILKPYYKSPNPLYTSAILIPSMHADLGPKAFNVEKEVQPSRWIVWYKGKVTAPTPGSFRFVGLCDDILLVKLDNQTVLDGSLSPVDKKKFDLPWKSSVDKGAIPLRRGEAFTCSGNETKDIDIIIGEEPGGFFYASLFVIKDGVEYPNDKSGLPQLPLFQIGSDYKLPVGKYPPVNSQREPWQGSSR